MSLQSIQSRKPITIHTKPYHIMFALLNSHSQWGMDTCVFYAYICVYLSKFIALGPGINTFNILFGVPEM